MESQNSPPFRAEHIGSLLRPPQLRRAFRDLRSGRISPEHFRQVQDACILQVVSMQEEAGLKCVTDGEFRRTSYWSHVVEAVDGLGVQTARFKFRDDQGNQTEFLAPQVEARIREVAAQPGIGGYRKIAAALLADHGIDVSHMKVKRVLAKTPVEVG